MNFICSFCVSLNKLFSQLVFGTNEFTHGYPEELERLIHVKKKRFERLQLFIHESSCEEEDEYDFVFLEPKRGPVKVSCKHCGFHLIVELDSLLGWREQLCLEETSTSIGVKIGKAKKRALLLVESTKSGNERERTIKNICSLPANRA